MPTAVVNPDFQPAMREIQDFAPSFLDGVGQWSFCQTTFAHNFLLGEILRFVIPKEFGMTQLDGLIGTIVYLDPVQPNFFWVNIDSTHFDTFVYHVAPLQLAQVVPIGEINSTLICATKNILRDGHR